VKSAGAFTVASVPGAGTADFPRKPFTSLAVFVRVAARFVNANSALSQAEGRELKLAEGQARRGCGKTPA